MNLTEVGKDDFYTFHQQPHSKKNCPQWINSMTLVMNHLLDSKLTEDSDEDEKGKKTLEKQENDAMFSCDCISLFDTEKSTFKPENRPTTSKDMKLVNKDDAIISKIKKLQENVRKQRKNNVEDKVPKITVVIQDTEKINNPDKPMEERVEVNEENTEKPAKMEEETPTENQPVEEDVESIGEEKAKAPPFLLTLEILNLKVHKCLVDSGSSVNVMPLAF